MEENATLNLTTWHSNPNAADSIDIMAYLFTRNKIFGIFATLVNILAFIVVLMSNKSNEGRKLLLLTLVTSDFVLSISLLAYGIKGVAVMSGDGACLPILVVMILANGMYFVTSAQLSLFTFLALYQPFRYRLLATWRNASIMVAVSLAINIVIGTWWVDFDVALDTVCIPQMIIPPHAFHGIRLLAFTAFLVIMPLNVAVLFRLYKTKTTHVLYLRPGSHPNKRDGEPTEKRNVSFQINAPKSIHLIRNFTRNNIVHPSPAPEKKRDNKTIETISFTGRNDEVCLSQVTPIEHKPGRSESVPRASPPVRQSQYDPHTSGETSSSGTEPGIERSDANISCVVGAPETDYASTLNSAESSSDNPSAHLHTPLQDKTRKSILILTTCSCLLGMPSVITIFGFTSDDQERVKLITSAFGVFITSCSIGRVCINPFIYVLNFVNWKKLRTPQR